MTTDYKTFIYKTFSESYRDYAPGLAWVTYNQKLEFHLCDMIHSTIFPTTQLVPRSTIVPIMICINAMHA